MPGSWADTYATIDSNGNVSFNFTGHVHAQGLDLDASDQFTVPSADKVRWIDTHNGAVVAEISAVRPTLGPAESEVTLQANTVAGFTATVRAAADAKNAKVVDANGLSSFMVGPPFLYRNNVAGGFAYTTIASFTLPAVSHSCLILLSGSAYQTVAGAMGYIDLYVDNGSIGASTQFFNELGSHRAFPTYGVVAVLAAGTHTIQAGCNTVGNGTASDGNDRIDINIIGIPSTL